MNTLESYEINTPEGGIGECSRFTVDDITKPFELHNILTHGQQYAISMWIKSEVEEGVNKAVMVYGEAMSALEEWNKYSHVFTATKTNLEIYFSEPGIYYIYHPQLERGNLATDWTESPLDTEDKITNAQSTADTANKGVQELYIKLEESIQMLVAGINGGTLLEQTEDGWKFVGGGTADQLKELSKALDDLSGTSSDAIEQLAEKVAANDHLSSYIKIDPEANPPMIRMGTYVIDAETGEGGFGQFSIAITPTAIQFLQDENPIAWISNQELYITKAVIKQELSIGGFVLKQHGTRNNVGFLWKGVTS